MSSLPPYSTFRTDSKQMMFPQATSHGNILTFTPPGFGHELNVKFPDSRLAVCEKCKKNFKTRDMCRVRNAHTAAPWTTAFICITLDASCTDESGTYIDKPLTVRMVQWQPYCVKKPFDPKTPVCAACKKTNRTRSFCRERHKHRQLPWCTVYVLLSALDQADPNTVVAAPSKLVDTPESLLSGGQTTPIKEEGKTDDGDAKQEGLAGTPTANSSFDSSQTTIPTSDESKNEKKKPCDDDGDDIHDIAESRTFLAKVSGESTTVHWLELAEYDATEAAQFAGFANAAEPSSVPAMNPAPTQGMDPNQAQYYAYAAQQHQRALKSHQQYYYQMHQHGQPQYPAQPVPWQGHYPGQPVAIQPVPGQPHQQQQVAPPPHGAHPPPHSPQAPPPYAVQAPPPYSTQAPPPPVAPQPHPPPPPQAQGQPEAEPTASPPVTAGEAAAQQRRSRQAAQAETAPPAPSAGEAAAAARQRRQQQEAQQNQQQQQQQHWQMYQQPNYSHPGPPPPHGYPPSPSAAPPPPHTHHAGPPPVDTAPSPTNAPVHAPIAQEPHTSPHQAPPPHHQHQHVYHHAPPPPPQQQQQQIPQQQHQHYHQQNQQYQQQYPPYAQHSPPPHSPHALPHHPHDGSDLSGEDNPAKRQRL